MQSPENASNDERYIEVPRTRLTESIKYLQDMFPALNTAIIDRAFLTSDADVQKAIDKLLRISSKFSWNELARVNTIHFSIQKWQHVV